MEKTMKVYYLLSEEGRKKSILAGGDGKRKQELEVPVTAELLELSSVDYGGDIELKVGYSGTGTGCATGAKIQKDHQGFWVLRDTYQNSGIFDAPQTIEQLISWEKARRDRRKKAQEELEAKAGENELRRKELKDEYEANLERRKSREALEKEAGIRRRKEKLDWIEQFGSGHLQRAFRLDYDCQRKYVEERSAKEFPDYILDFDDDLDYEERVCPSEVSLRIIEPLIEKGYSAQVVWVTPESDSYYDYEDESSSDEYEAVLIRFYLDRYQLYLPTVIEE